MFERLRGMIISLELPPGSPLSRAALAEQFGVSSTPIRDALMRLEEEGLVDVFPQYATVVSRIDVHRAQQAHFLRQALELEIVRLLALQTGCCVGRRARTPRSRGSSNSQRPATSRNSWRPTMISTRELYEAADKQDIWTLVQQPQRPYRPAAPAASALARQGAGYRAPSQADRESDRRRRA